VNARNTGDGGVAGTPLDALLAEYVSGTLSPSLTLLVASHLELRPDSRAYVVSLASAAGQWLDSIDPVAISRGADMLRAILESDDRPSGSAPAAPSSADAFDPAIPAALRRHIERQRPKPQWRWLLPGIRKLQVSSGVGDQAFLLHGRPGRALPAHVHAGTEVTLVLSGIYADAGGRYRPGDIAICEGGTEHRPVIDHDADCICLIVLDGPIRLSGPVGRVIDWVTGGSVGRLAGG
jgi:putative transcriptional regulator